MRGWEGEGVRGGGSERFRGDDQFLCDTIGRNVFFNFLLSASISTDRRGDADRTRTGVHPLL